ncbi:MAG: hypothetical protein UE295_03425 [Acutalibacteraceae bacterium]|nr:hypothetical protein [Acutalibacteraceae bacterium]
MLDDIIELFIEIFGEVFVNMITSLIPEDKMTKKKAKAIKVAVSVLSCVILLICMIGIGMLVESKCTSLIGWSFVAISAIYFIVCITLYLVSNTNL